MDWNKIIADCYRTIEIKDKNEILIGTAKDIASLDCIPAVFQNIVAAALVFAGIVAVFMIVFAGIKYITSGGDPKQLEGARATLTWAVIGLVVILTSFFIINLIAGITGAEVIKKFGFPTR